MKIYRSLPFTLLFAAQIASAQHFHELKADFVLPFFQTPHLGYEFVWDENLGIEAGLWYRWAEDGTYYVPPTTTFYEAVGKAFYTQQQVLIASMAAKYYLFRHAPGSGAYLGGYLREDVLVSQPDPQYDYLYLSNYRGFDAENHRYNRQLRLATGLVVGYKRLLGKHLLVEASVGMDVEPFKKYPWGNLYGIPGLRIGYRL